MAKSDLAAVWAILTSTLSIQEWEVVLPIDVPVQALLAKFLRTPELGFRARDDNGYLIPWRLLWREGNRFLNEAETLRGAGFEARNTLVLTTQARAVGGLRLEWDEVDVSVSCPPHSQEWQTSLPVDVTVVELTNNLLRSPVIQVGPQDDCGRSLVYRLMWREGNRILTETETLRRAGIKPGDSLVLVGEPLGASSSQTQMGGTSAGGESPLGSSREKVFVSYSHRDAPWLERLRVHLKSLERRGLIDAWDDTKIEPGMRWRKEIEAALSGARIAVLLVSGDFLASEFIMEQELPSLLTAAAADGAKILPVIVRPCLFEQEEELADFQAVNSPNRPLSSMDENEQEEALVKVARSIITFMKNR